MHRLIPGLALSLSLFFGSALAAQTPETGPLVRAGGGVFPVPDPTFSTPIELTYRVAFDVSRPSAEASESNPSFDSVARFLNMHARAGVPAERLQVAVVVHGGAALELLDNAAYRERNAVDNPNARLIEQLQAAGARIILCGQTAAFRGIDRTRLLAGTQVALSAMTAMVVLQELGYHVNPF